MPVRPLNVAPLVIMTLTTIQDLIALLSPWLYGWMITYRVSLAITLHRPRLRGAECETLRPLPVLSNGSIATSASE